MAVSVPRRSIKMDGIGKLLRHRGDKAGKNNAALAEKGVQFTGIDSRTPKDGAQQCLLRHIKIDQ